jgi:Clostripain family
MRIGIYIDAADDEGVIVGLNLQSVIQIEAAIALVRGRKLPGLTVRYARNREQYRRVIRNGNGNGSNTYLDEALWIGTRDLDITSATPPTLTSSSGTPYQGDLYDAQAISSFVTTLTNAHSADQCVLVLNGHAEPPSTILRGTNEKYLSLANFKSGLNAGRQGNKLGVIGFDGCDAASLELAIELAQHTDYLVGSEMGMLPQGWPYGVWPQVVNDAATAGIAAQKLIDCFVSQNPAPVSMSAITLSKLGDITTALRKLSDRIIDDPSVCKIVGTARKSCINLSLLYQFEWQPAGGERVDLVDLVMHIKLLTTDSELLAVCTVIQESVRDACSVRSNLGYLLENLPRSYPILNGISIYFPLRKEDASTRNRDAYDDDHELPAFKAATNWHNALSKLMN